MNCFVCSARLGVDEVRAAKVKRQVLTLCAVCHGALFDQPGKPFQLGSCIEIRGRETKSVKDWDEVLMQGIVLSWNGPHHLEVTVLEENHYYDVDVAKSGEDWWVSRSEPALPVRVKIKRIPPVPVLLARNDIILHRSTSPDVIRLFS